MRGDCGFSPKPKDRPVKIATSLKSLRKKNMIAVLTKFELNVLWQVSSFACTKSHRSHCRNCLACVQTITKL